MDFVTYKQTFLYIPNAAEEAMPMLLMMGTLPILKNTHRDE